ncbi:MAG: glutaminyl-tRNA synthase (glutamine-hydrolyzing) subunit B [Candidatus Wildermuthbacteria bacterium RIFCSPHIGHO2_12_FULL_45_9]|uniref:Aspartyl/glutamyl-tRNA(Asn/Gln) amidotransferase subunit B n=1 Tax=Candidatus Wildermuthbacteria bacterium RIFCSPHIGHO2_02_FULL_45_25 TaxID=1802450 RepID=A0A1G2QZJ8_9BACT|nr:MAG: glutaminyl-tRNA synthase (glutamine-hydrolyzing) subunit B [Candidatus Wildermuthbacteria bacterium RIFCSPHIGHO2_01_FULL_45_20]OHA65251.1 MAG: glutaminyl-tRNA synthase (glutamine-hydrolyzing) subunit B [Candidatus Wildermuthbacteria bacterium RIFCSPHIGHO2_02_FULL_45_25]OHA71440.1 MAG: glutaminyl-tRNA synthase (glutamine-hydrolyzing) subunit B [Candidatus Wildermuthbacteria bacterium RIFCSPHIGHO2_12_FULL_45_9]
MRYIPTIGLEIHAELKTRSKMFCSCLNDPLQKDANTNVCPICMGHPGTLPVANKDAITNVIKVGLALDCAIAPFSKFDRKNYFYPDLPKGYQISQYDLPLCEHGKLRVFDRQIQIRRIHLEEDTARSQHQTDKTFSLVDFNRAGVPLMELVTEPDIQSSQEASEFARQLQTILRYLQVSDADMEKGQMRVEANISIRPERQKEFGTKVEVKNLNSFRSVEQAIEFEIARQTESLVKGQQIRQETHGWNELKGETFLQREKESAHDYRYFPEPDIPPMKFSKEEIEALRACLPELPQARKDRFQREFNLTQKEADALVKNKDMGEYFEQVVSELGPLEKDQLRIRTKLSVNYMLSDLQGYLQATGTGVQDSHFLVTAENFAELINLIADNKISSAAAKSVLKEMLRTGADPDHIIEERGLHQISDAAQIEQIAKEIIQNNPKALEDYKKGKGNALQFFVGQMMAKTKGSLNPETSREIVARVLTSL